MPTSSGPSSRLSPEIHPRHLGSSAGTLAKIGSVRTRRRNPASADSLPVNSGTPGTRLRESVCNEAFGHLGGSGAAAMGKAWAGHEAVNSHMSRVPSWFVPPPTATVPRPPKLPLECAGRERPAALLDAVRGCGKLWNEDYEKKRCEFGRGGLRRITVRVLFLRPSAHDLAGSLTERALPRRLALPAGARLPVRPREGTLPFAPVANSRPETEGTDIQRGRLAASQAHISCAKSHR
jgi:hypothetical protein